MPSHIETLVEQFHHLIRKRVSEEFQGLTLPPLPDSRSILLSTSDAPGWLPVPGMYGGFKFHLEPSPLPHLVVSSWSRLVDGSEQVHDVNAEAIVQRQEKGPAESSSVLETLSSASLRVVSWNINNRVGRTRFRPEAAQAAMALDADVIIFNEFFAGNGLEQFRADLAARGWRHQVMSLEPTIKANRVLIASRVPIRRIALPASTVDEHLSSNAAAALLPGSVVCLGVRVPTYKQADLSRAWDWLEKIAEDLRREHRGKVVIVGDLNTSLAATGRYEIKQFHRLLANGWKRAQPEGIGSYFSARGDTHEIDHVLSADGCRIGKAQYVTATNGYKLAGPPSEGAISDHAVLTFDIA